MNQNDLLLCKAKLIDGNSCNKEVLLKVIQQQTRLKIRSNRSIGVLTIRRVLVATQFYGRIYNRHSSTKKVYELDIFIHFIVILSYFLPKQVIF